MPRLPTTAPARHRRRLRQPAKPPSADAARILAEAQSQAEAIVAQAKSESEHIRATAATDLERQTRSLRGEVQDLQERRAAILAQLGQIRDIVGGVASDSEELDDELADDIDVADVEEAADIDEIEDVEPTEEVSEAAEVEEIADSGDDLDAEAQELEAEQLVNFEDLDPRSRGPRSRQRGTSLKTAVV